MTKTNLGNTVFSGSERAAMRWITLPDDLAKWADQNREMVERVQNALTDTYDTLTEEQLWEVVAGTCSPEWKKAKAELHLAEHLWEDMNSPEKIPLGLIGNALDSDKTNSAMEQFAFSLATFTIINEGLRQREDLGRLLSVLLVQKRMLELSAERTQHLRKAADNFAALNLAKPHLTQVTAQASFSEAAARKPVLDRADLKKAFKYAQNFFMQRKEKTPRNVPVPSSPEI